MVWYKVYATADALQTQARHQSINHAKETPPKLAVTKT